MVSRYLRGELEGIRSGRKTKSFDNQNKYRRGGRDSGVEAADMGFGPYGVRLAIAHCQLNADTVESVCFRPFVRGRTVLTQA